jgi:hypothetical protein
MNPVHTLPYCFFKIHCNTLSSTSDSSKQLFPSGFSTKTLCAFLISPIPVTCPSYLILNLITQIMLLRNTSYEAPHYAVLSNLLLFHPSWLKIFSSAPCSQTSCVCSSLNVRDQVSHPYKTAGCIVSNLESVERFVMLTSLVSALGS